MINSLLDVLVREIAKYLTRLLYLTRPSGSSIYGTALKSAQVLHTKTANKI